MEFKLNEGQKQEVFDERLKNNRQATIRHGIIKKEAYCRICNFRCRGKDSSKEARKHAEETGHTIDIYSETQTEINYVN